ncbi:MAG: hypothetical protein FMNOHCHN_02174 [Ignavibacteriaceae bacterium]|nr:hypothetical protein [Ignavibacteriaceae bacterium]
MEKNNINRELDIVLKANEHGFIFELNEPEEFQKELIDTLKKKYFELGKNAVVVYPEQRIVEAHRIFIETTAQIL